MKLHINKMTALRLCGALGMLCLAACSTMQNSTTNATSPATQVSPTVTVSSAAAIPATTPSPPPPPPQLVTPPNIVPPVSAAPVLPPVAQVLPPTPSSITPPSPSIPQPSAKNPAPASARTGAPVTEAPAKSTSNATPAAVSSPATTSSPAPLDVRSLTTRLKDTKAIGIFTKLALKNQVDDLLQQFRTYYKGQTKPTLVELRRPYEMLMLKVLALLQDGDTPLANAIVASREAIWGLLSDPAKFATI